MEQFERMSRLDALRAEDRTEQQKHGDWMRSLDKKAQDAFISKVLAFQDEELGPELNHMLGNEDLEKELSDRSEPVQQAIRASLSYMDALYRAALAREALKALQEPPDEP